jgi:hypothetical protein
VTSIAAPSQAQRGCGFRDALGERLQNARPSEITSDPRVNQDIVDQLRHVRASHRTVVAS